MWPYEREEAMRIESIPTFVCAALLIAILGATIFGESFRHDILSGTGDVKMFGLLTVTGVALVLIVALLMGGLLLSVKWMWKYQRKPLEVRSVKSDPELLNDLRKAYPEVAFSDDFGVVDIPVGEDGMTLKYLRIPIWFVETFLLDRQLANNIRRR